MKDAVIGSNARIQIQIGFKGSLNNINFPSISTHAMERAGVSGEKIDDVIIKAVLTGPGLFEIAR